MFDSKLRGAFFAAILSVGTMAAAQASAAPFCTGDDGRSANVTVGGKFIRVEFLKNGKLIDPKRGSRLFQNYGASHSWGSLLSGRKSIGLKKAQVVAERFCATGNTGAIKREPSQD